MNRETKINEYEETRGINDDAKALFLHAECGHFRIRSTGSIIMPEDLAKLGIKLGMEREKIVECLEKQPNKHDYQQIIDFCSEERPPLVICPEKRPPLISGIRSKLTAIYMSIIGNQGQNDTFTIIEIDDQNQNGQEWKGGEINKTTLALIDQYHEGRESSRDMKN
jgi:hypothetical protein